MESQQILDILFKHDPITNTTVMICLMNGGTLSSFEIDSDYEMQDLNRTTRKIKQVEEEKLLEELGEGGEAGLGEGDKKLTKKKVQENKKRDKIDIIQSLVAKLLDENDAGGQGFSDESFFVNLEDDELEIIKEIIDDLSWWMELAGPMLVICVPILIWFIRSRIHNNRLTRYQDQIDRIQRDINVQREVINQVNAQQPINNLEDVPPAPPPAANQNDPIMPNVIVDPEFVQ